MYDSVYHVLCISLYLSNPVSMSATYDQSFADDHDAQHATRHMEERQSRLNRFSSSLAFIHMHYRTLRFFLPVRTTPSASSPLQPPSSRVSPSTDDPDHPDAQSAQQPRPVLAATAAIPAQHASTLLLDRLANGFGRKLVLPEGDAKEVVCDARAKEERGTQGREWGRKGCSDFDESRGWDAAKVGSGGVVEEVKDATVRE